VDRFNSSSRDDEAPLVELAVLLFFLMDILCFLLDPNKMMGANCCGVAKLPSTNNEREQKAREPKPKLKHKQKKIKNSFSTVNF
jgi:hypothetical protein